MRLLSLLASAEASLRYYGNATVSVDSSEEVPVALVEDEAVLRDGYCGSRKFTHCYPPTEDNPNTNCVDVVIDGQHVDQVSVNGQIVDPEKCIFVVIGLWTSWAESDLICKTQAAGSVHEEGHLMSIHNGLQNTKIKQIIDASTNEHAPFSPYWIGLRQHSLNSEFEWSNFSPVDYVNWYPGEPNNAGDGEDCGQFTAWDSHWNDDDCNKGFQFVCEVYKEQRPLPPNLDQSWPAAGFCKEGWTKYAKGCYLKVGQDTKNHDGEEDQKNFNDARTYCGGQWQGADLVILHNVFYNFFLASFVKGFGRNVWLGGQSTTQDSQFHWIDNSRLTFSNWISGRPVGITDEDSNNLEDEMIMRYSGNLDAPAGTWYDKDGRTPHGFICEHKLDSGESNHGHDLCPDGWMSYSYGCYKLSFEAKGYKQANDDCAAQWQASTGDKKWFSSLATITDQFENDFVTAMMYGEQTNFDLNFNSYAGAWIGYHGNKDADNVVSFNWMDDYFSSTYTKWYYGEPAVEFALPETEFCIYMLAKNDMGGQQGAGNWRTEGPCVSQRPYICKAIPPNVIPELDQRGEMKPCNESHGWLDAGKHVEPGTTCLKAFKGEKKVSFYEAETHCNQVHGGHLASIHSNAGNQRLLEIVASSIGNKYWAWIGLKDNNAGGHMWTDGSAVDFLYWGPGWGPKDPDQTSCADIGSEGLWSSETCSNKNYYVCQIQKPYEKCMSVPIQSRVPCGYPGISMNGCLDEMKCCWDGTAGSRACFTPGITKSTAPSTGSGMSVAGAVFLTMFMWAIPAAGMIYFYMFKGPSASAAGGIANVSANF